MIVSKLRFFYQCHGLLLLYFRNKFVSLMFFVFFYDFIFSWNRHFVTMGSDIDNTWIPKATLLTDTINVRSYILKSILVCVRADINYFWYFQSVETCDNQPLWSLTLFSPDKLCIYVFHEFVVNISELLLQFHIY